MINSNKENKQWCEDELECNLTQDSKHCILVGTQHSVINFNYEEMSVNENMSILKNEIYVNSLIRSGDGEKEKIIVGQYGDGKKKIWDNNLSQEIEEIQIIHPVDVKMMSENIMIVGTYDNDNLHVIQLKEDRKHIVIFKDAWRDYWGFPNTICKINAEICANGTSRGNIAVLNYKKSKFLEVISSHNTSYINSIIKLKRVEGLASAGQDDTIRLWSYESGLRECVSMRINGTNTVENWWSKLKEFSDGRIAYSDKNFQIRLIDYRCPAGDPSIFKSHYAFVYDTHQISEYEFLSTSRDKSIKKWDLRKENEPISNFIYKGFIYRFEL